jgi:hypothetical protein
MPLDTSIPLQSRFTPINYESPQPINALMGVMKIKQLGEESDLNALRKQEFLQNLEDKNLLRDYIATSDMSTPEGRAGTMRYGKIGLEYNKALNEQQTSALTQKKTGFDIQKSKKDFISQAQRDTSQNPSDENIKAYVQDLDLNPLFSDAEKVQMKAGADRILAMPVDQRQGFMASQGATPRDLKSTTMSQTTGATNRMVNIPAFGGAATVVPGSEVNVTATPAQLEANRVANARLALEQQKFNYEKANPGMELKEDADGNLFGINKRTLQVMPVNISGEGVPAVSGGIPSARAPAVQNALTPGAAVEPTSAPQQFKGKGTALTESQGNATAFGLRMKDSNAILEKLAKEGTLRGANIEATPFVGEQLGKVLPGFLGGTNAAQQQVNQAKTNFITAVLRKESGAAIAASEFATEDRKYFPQLNDDKKTIEQKANARKLAIKAMEIQAGPGAKQIQQYVPSSGANENDPLGLLGGR